MRRILLENLVKGAALLRYGRGPSKKVRPDSIFVLRNNDLGDLLVVTPMFEALKNLFPESRLVAGVGKWSHPILENNPFLDDVVEVNAPWHNKFVSKNLKHNSAQGFLRSLNYILRSDEAKRLRKMRFDTGVDVLGSPEGSLLMLRAGIPWRLGVRGYAGGDSACQQVVQHDNGISVGRASLRFAELLGADPETLPPAKPQLFLTDEEKEYGLQVWSELAKDEKIRRIIIAPGGGAEEKCWPRENYKRLVQELSQRKDTQLIVVGGQDEHPLGEFVKADFKEVVNLCGKTSLRETFSLVSGANGVICNSSMILHAAAAFEKPTIVLLSANFSSASNHQKLWGHGEKDIHLGLHAGRSRIFEPEEVISMMDTHFKKYAVS